MAGVGKELLVMVFVDVYFVTNSYGMSSMRKDHCGFSLLSSIVRN